MRVHPLQQAFTGGELSPLMLAQAGFVKAPVGCRRLSGLLPLPQGPAKRRPGTQYLGRYQDETRSIRLVPFVVSETEAYVLEIGHEGAVVWRAAGTLVTDAPELVTNGTFASAITGWTDVSLFGSSIAWDATQALRLNGGVIVSLVANGTFTTNLAGWTDASVGGASIAWDAGRLRLRNNTGPTADAVAYQALTSLTIGQRYEVRFTAEQARGRFTVTNNPGGTGQRTLTFPDGTTALFLTPAIGQNACSFVAAQTTQYIRFNMDSFVPPTPHDLHIDNVIVGAEGIAIARQAIAVTMPVDAHTLRLRVVAGPVTVRVGTTAGAADLVADTNLVAGTHAIAVDPGGTDPVYLEIQTTLGTRLVDDVSLTLTTAVPVAITTPYEESHLSLLQWAQSADVLYIGCPHHPFGKVRRFADLDWDWTEVMFSVPPTAEFGRAPNTTLTPAATTGLAVTFTAGAAAFVASDVGRDIVAKPGRATILSQASTSCTADITEAFRSTAAIPAGDWHLDVSPQTTCTPNVAGPVGAAVTLTLAAAGWEAADVGKWVYLNSGIVEITGFTSNVIVSGRVRVLLSGTTAAAAGAWSLEEPVFSDARGHLVAPAFHEGRLHVGHGFTDYGSRSDDYEHFGRGSTADAALVHPLTAGQLNTITALVSGPRDLLAGTTGPGFRLTGQGGPITPDNPPNVKRAWKEATARAQPLVIDPTVIVPEAGGRKVLGIGFNFDKDAYEAPDLVILAEHLAAHGFVEIVLTARPTPVLWARDTIGGLYACTYLPEQAVLAWSRQPIGGDGVVEALCAVPDGTGRADVLFLGVRRTVDGATVRSIERLDPTADVYVDAHMAVSGSALTSVSGLDHLEGFTVQIRGDGATLPSQVVASGTVSLPAEQPADHVQAGLYYETSLIPMPVEGGNPAGSARGTLQKFVQYLVFLHETRGATVNGAALTARSPDDLLGVPPALLTGTVAVVNPGAWVRDGLTEIRQDEPQPLTVVGLGGVLLVEP